ncbi:MAG: zinc metallopeptidase [Flavobacteriales bacterium]|nr:zinc metallopeptidase [Flavobacteriales bacterium]
MGYDYFILIGAIALVSMLVSNTLKRKFKKYSATPLRSGLSGKEVAEKMLADHGLYDVQVISVAGRLTDHYNPKDKTVNLSEAVYHQRNAAAAAVAAHECGHAVQHAKAYTWLEFRSSMVPIVNFSARFINIALIAGIVLAGTMPQIMWFAIGLMAVTTLFSIVTLPVEYDASNRALAWIKEKNVVAPDEYELSKDALKWAARTYLVAALSSVATLLYFFTRYVSRD